MLIPTCFSSAMVCCRDCLGGVVVVAVVSLSAVGASMSENPSDSLSASQPASPELIRVCRRCWGSSGEEEVEKEDAEEREGEKGLCLCLLTLSERDMSVDSLLGQRPL